MEEWRDVIGYEGLYKVSNEGKVMSFNLYSHKKPRLLALHDQNSGYKIVHLSKDGKSKTYLVHRLVATAFVDNPNNYDFVNHKDENKKNNNVDNLEWCTKSYNSSYYLSKDCKRKEEYANRLINKETGKNYSSWTTRVPHTHFEAVTQINKNGEVIGYFKNPTDAAIASGSTSGNILVACKWNKTHEKKHTSKGYIWEFSN